MRYEALQDSVELKKMCIYMLQCNKKKYVGLFNHCHLFESNSIKHNGMDFEMPGPHGALKVVLLVTCATF